MMGKYFQVAHWEVPLKGFVLVVTTVNGTNLVKRMF